MNSIILLKSGIYTAVKEITRQQIKLPLHILLFVLSTIFLLKRNSYFALLLNNENSLRTNIYRKEIIKC